MQAGALAASALCISALATLLPDARAALEWQREAAWQQPWRLWTAAIVHFNPQHLMVNVLGCVALAFAGASARMSSRAVRTWLLAWPLTHLALLAASDLQRYVGLSGVLHAGVAVLAVELTLARQGRDRRVGLALAAGLALKLLLERPWLSPVSVGGDWPFPVASVAHLTGAISGAACATLAIRWSGRSCADAATLRNGSSPSERRQP
jgi:rhomboid family GlyGly-CTERM serine protease